MKRLLINNWPVVVLILLSILIVWPLFLPGYFSHHDDLQVMRIYEMRKCFKDLQIPCRWVPDMGYGNGFPLFNYYSVLPYYLGAVASLVLGFIGAAKLMFFIPLVLGGLSMYVLTQDLFGKRAGFTAGVLFAFAPYRALDSYVRGDITESLALAIIPLVFYFALRVIKQRNKFTVAGLALSLGAFLISHNIMAIYFIPILIVWILLWFYLEGRKNLNILLLGLGLGFGLSAFFVFPAFFEKSLVTVENLTRFDLNFRANFTDVKNLFFDNSWGYEGLHGISFQIGWPHWWLVVLSVPVLVWLYKKRIKENREKVTVTILFLIAFLVSIFMTHNKSAFIWERVSILQYSQFPWRFLSIAIFSSSIIGAFLVSLITGRNQIIFLLVVCSLTIFLNWNFFKPEQFFPYETDQTKLTEKSFEIQQKASILDYLPKTASEPKEEAPYNPVVVSGEAKISGFTDRSNSFLFGVDTIKPSRIEVPVFDFPNWQTESNGLQLIHDHKNILGRISFNLPKGNFRITGEFRNTPVRVISDLLTLVSLFGLYLVLIYGQIRKIFR